MKKNLLFLSASLLIVLPSVAQNKIQQTLEILSEKFPQEKLVLNLPKSEFVAGENIFFKAYTLNGYTPVAYSTNLYVELYDHKKNLVDTALFPIYKGTAAGSMAIPTNLAEGVYYMRAYTRWMLNFDERFNYIKAFKVHNRNSRQRLVEQPVMLTARAFPEAGHLRPGILSKVVVRLDGNNTLPDSFKATLFEKGNDKPIATTESLNSQLAVLQIVPRAGHSYFVTVTDDQGHTTTADLPRAEDDAVVLQVFNEGDDIKYLVHFGSKNLTGAGYKIVGTVHDKPIFRADVKNSAGSISNSIRTADLPNGVMMITVFDENDNAVAQRLTFIKPTEIATVEPQLLTDTLDLAAKSRNSWQFQMDSSLWYSYSAEVQDANAPVPENFLSQIFLSSDFPTAIANPSWYFENMDDKKAAALDALLITETWRRFNWKEILAERYPKPSSTSESYLTFIGTVKRNNKIARNNDINLILKDSKGFVQILNTASDSSGRIFMNQIFTDTLKVAYQLNEKKATAQNVKIDFEPVHHFSPLKGALPAANIAMVYRDPEDAGSSITHIAKGGMENERLVNEKIKDMENVTVSYNRQSATQRLNNKLSSAMFSSFDEVVIDFVNEDQTSAMTSSNILEWLQGRVSGYELFHDKGEWKPQIRREVVPVFIDEIRYDPSALVGFPVTDIAMVKVIKGVFLGVPYGSQGAIIIYTRRGDMLSKSRESSLPSTRLTGYNSSVSFFEPDYSDTRLLDVPDSRETLLWRDFLVPDEEYRTNLKFYNNDHAQKYRLIITGFSATGVPVYLEKNISTR